MAVNPKHRPQGSEEVLLLRAFLLRVIAPLALGIGAAVVICAYFLVVA